MHLTQETDYAMRIIYCLAKSGRRMDASSISEEMRISLRFSLKILGKLAGAGLVNSYKGMRGGYELARPADQITLKQVLDVIEGHAYAISRCLCEGEDCNRGDVRLLCLSEPLGPDYQRGEPDPLRHHLRRYAGAGHEPENRHARLRIRSERIPSPFPEVGEGRFSFSVRCWKIFGIFFS